MSENKIHIYRYQPILADTVIYWSLTFVLFFASMIGLLEEQGRINLFSIVTFLLFLFFFYLGTRRKLILTQDQIKINAVLKKNEYTIDINKIKKVLVGKYGFTLVTKQHERSYLMLPSSKSNFITHLEQSSHLNCGINGYKKGVDN
ncbi:MULTISPECIES: EbsA family protein [Vagococcus]|uniref:EbsA protein n=1 Tax=Vagococcus teuberi TaxID=519472 RepID=A0A1J0A6Q2_9ENTE|nr:MULTISPECIES: EbsA family protein [Vagococcus]APB31593.1 hypothetical protein BHY08_06975 [Vagococcus teuberi]RHH71429.1 hypothetical protein DW196_02545 [Vagococcus sp. AM17-17]